MTAPTVTHDLEVQIDHGQLYIYSHAPWNDDPDSDARERALNDARNSHRWVGIADGLVDLVTPVQWNLNAPIRVEIWTTEPPADDDRWDHVVDVDLDLMGDTLHFQASGGWSPITCELPSGEYRARVAGRGYQEAGREGAEGLDAYQLRLWPRTTPAEPALRKCWPGWSVSADKS
ncbi:hypothetical protein [Saccharothrix sp. Mg75]|uniref:hypothetical protein n=1 Tax=Saccharothrix sp. Mg75 TaxID=3445357 RepID=UPI003EEE65F6